jgi:hypothetical protein
VKGAGATDSRCAHKATAIGKQTGDEQAFSELNPDFPGICPLRNNEVLSGLMSAPDVPGVAVTRGKGDMKTASLFVEAGAAFFQEGYAQTAISCHGCQQLPVIDKPASLDGIVDMDVRRIFRIRVSGGRGKDAL